MGSTGDQEHLIWCEAHSRWVESRKQIYRFDTYRSSLCLCVDSCFPVNVCSEKTSEEEEENSEEVFTVELQKGPYGLGLALVDGTKTALQISGIYVKSVVPESPADHCGRLKIGDRILAVNGISLVGMDYNIGRELIRSSGDTLKLLVAKIDPKLINKATVTTKC